MLPLSLPSLSIDGIPHKITQQEHFSFGRRVKKNFDKANRRSDQRITPSVLRWFYDSV